MVSLPYVPPHLRNTSDTSWYQDPGKQTKISFKTAKQEPWCRDPSKQTKISKHQSCESIICVLCNKTHDDLYHAYAVCSICEAYSRMTGKQLRRRLHPFSISGFIMNHLCPYLKEVKHKKIAALIREAGCCTACPQGTKT